MSDTQWDFIHEKMAEYKQAQEEAMERECENCDSRVTLGCPFYDEEEETFDYITCFQLRK